MLDYPRAVTIANDETIIEMICSTNQRFIRMAPGFYKGVAAAIIDRWPKLHAEAVAAIVDTDPEVFRLGLGDFEAMRRLKPADGVFGMHRSCEYQTGAATENPRGREPAARNTRT